MGSCEVVAVVGNNAAGKSTLLRTIVGDQRSVSGEIRINTLVPNPEAVAFRRLLSTVTDADAFFSSLTVQEHLTMVAAGHGVKNVGSVVDAELSFFDLFEIGRASCRHLSSGQR